MPLNGNTRFHLTAQAWHAAAVTPEQLLSRLKGELSFFSHFQSGNGTFPDPVSGTISGSVQANFAYSAAVLAQSGDRTFVAQAIKAMNSSAADYAAGAVGQNGGKDGPEFELPPLVKAYMLFRDNGLASAAQIAQWAHQLAGFHYTPSQLDGNWSTYAIDGAWLQYKAGLVSHATAVAEIESIWTKYQSARENSGTDGLYVDATPTPDSLSVEAVGRGNFTDIIARGYDGPSAGAIAAVVQQGGARSLLMEDPIGQVPAGGRTDNHLWVDAGYQAIDQTLANMNAASNPALAAQYQEAANLTFQEMSVYRQADGSFSVTKNQYPGSARVGYQDASSVGAYNSKLMAATADTYLTLKATHVAAAPAPSEVGGYVYTAPATFAASFAAAGGTQIEIETTGRTSNLKGLTWNALGIARISATGMDARLGPADGIYNAASGRGITFAPEWQQNGVWTRLADHPGDYHGSVTTNLASPLLTIVTVVWKAGGFPTFTQNITITPDGVLSRTTQSGTGAFGMTLPLLHFDGRTTLTQTVGNGVASVAYPGGGSSENFLALNANTVLTKGADMLSAYGQLTPVSAVSSAKEQDTFVYQSSSGDPSASSVRSSFQLSPTGYTSSLGWVDGTLYSGRTSAGGFGSSIALSGSGAPDVTFSKAVDFVLQIKGGTITNVETGAAVTAVIGGKTISLAANSPQVVSGGSQQPPVATITLAPLGVVQEASVGAGVTVLEKISTTNVTGPIYQEILTSGGVVESGFQPVALSADGSATVSVHLAHSGDYMKVVDKLVSPKVTAVSLPVTITDHVGLPPAPVTIGSGLNTLALQVSEDAWNGNAQFTVAVDGRQIGATQTALASHAAGQTQIFNVKGNFAAGTHSATVNYINNAYKSPTADRNLYVTGATINGNVVPAAALTEYVNGPQSFSFMSPSTDPPPPFNVVTVDHPAVLAAATQTITGTESDPSKAVFLDWRTFGVPALDAGDWVQASVQANGKFSAVVAIDHPGISSTMYYRSGSGPATVAWMDKPI